jgi:hydrogenase expression/formation protein HypC
MCLAIPAQVLELDTDADQAVVSLGGVKKPVSLALVEDVAVGDYLLVHVGYALNKISPDEAARTLALMQAAGALDPTEFDLDATATEPPR